MAYPHAIGTAVDEQYGAGNGIDPLQEEGQWILPERVIVDRVQRYGWSITGHPEPWGTSQFVEKPEDVVLFRSIELFNKKHGPSLTEQFFRGTDVHK